MGRVTGWGYAELKAMDVEDFFMSYENLKKNG
jgi:hypothetical protein